MEQAGNVFLSLVSRGRARMNWEIALYALLIVIALVMRLWELGARAIHYDEVLHLVYSWNFAQGQGYSHDPMMHGPFQFHGNALIFFLFGDSDFTARLLPVIFGTALVALPFFLRRYLGRWGSLAVATLLAFSPLLLYYSRYARNDIYSAFWSLLLVVCMWRYFEERKARYLYIGAAALSLSFCTKEISYITVGIVALFLIVVAAKELVSRVRKRFDLKDLSPPAEYLILIGTLSLPLFAAFIQLIPGVELPDGLHWAKVLAVALLVIVSMIIGILWNWRRWLTSALIFYGIFTLLYTTFFTNLSGFGSGIWGSVDYWLDVRAEPRIIQPGFYYPIILATYEFLPLLFASIGAIYYTIKGNLFSRFLVYWAILSLILFCFSWENPPWLSLHIALPVILLSGMFIGRLFQGFDWRGAKAWAIRGVTVLALLLLFPFSFHVACQESYQKGDEPPQMLLYAGMSSDMPRIMDQIEELARETGEGKEIAITLDWDLYWLWHWYFRDYKNVDYSIDQPKGSVLILSTDHEPADESYLEKYGEGERIKQLIWFPEEYRDFDLGWWWGYFLHRETLGPYWTTEGVVYFPKSSP
ncbi:MAG: hypothetical protein AMJ37_00720 [Dehalococcoidia bacterium DG_18]|nr:MAG: hypothetical protein AMJ37_00720 [Dehalococcoidia bacterium DG_18]